MSHEFVELEIAPGVTRIVRRRALPEDKRSDGLKAPMVITDTMPETWHPANGLHYTSKAAFRRATKDAGCVEFGNEKIRPRNFKPRLSKEARGRDIKRAIDELKSR